MMDCISSAPDCSECNEPVCRHIVHPHNDYDDPVLTGLFDRDDWWDDE